ncbi:hypothetical protein Pan153_39170 [Gimesia panareensis]|uniref:Uncharacterized protein n=1 Tax=Gimesia panareensis TaxID=2527978 RepID=A0A518FSD0_9PLAN|nr:hypothetical protein [Gimesia panareensis]QDV19252.1 hypothetical protein Pan153_39170 [Gimesia panareensis]
MEENQESVQPEPETEQDVTEELPPKEKFRLLKRTAIWFLAFVLAASAMIYQRMTGPTYPMKVLVTGDIVAKLIRTHESTSDAMVELPVDRDKAQPPSATLYFKRFRTDDEFTAVPMQGVEKEDRYQLEAPLPKQPAAGKLEYYIQANLEGKERRFPENPDKNVVIRFKDPVPSAILIPHVSLMIFSILLGMRTGLAALFAPYNMRLLAWITLCGMTVGGMILGPFVQKYAFGEYWTGFPMGGDWTDNKMLFMFLAWVFACSVIGLNPKKKTTILHRIVVFTAAIVMTVCYLIPHSMGGSELDYSQVDKGIDPSEAIKTGRQ